MNIIKINNYAKFDLNFPRFKSYEGFHKLSHVNYCHFVKIVKRHLYVSSYEGHPIKNETFFIV